MRRMTLEQAQEEWEMLLQVFSTWEEVAKFLDNLEIIE